MIITFSNIQEYFHVLVFSLPFNIFIGADEFALSKIDLKELCYFAVHKISCCSIYFLSFSEEKKKSTIPLQILHRECISKWNFVEF